MKYRTLGLFPWVFAAAFAAAALALGDRFGGVIAVENETGKLLGLAGCCAAAFAFEHGEYLRRAWLTYAANYAFLLGKDAVGIFRPAALDGHADLAQGLLTLAGNACLVAAAWMLARAWRVAGLEDDDDERRHRRNAILGAVLASAAITGWALVHDVRALAGGEVDHLVSVASDLGDAFFIVLIAPVLQTAMALRGGVLRWPWGFVTAAGLAWMAYDLSTAVVDAFATAPALLVVASEAMRALANGYTFAAGAAQRKAVTQSPASIVRSA